MAKKKSDFATKKPSSSTNLTFSFQYYDLTQSGEYCLSSWSRGEVKRALNVLRDICSKSFATLSAEKRVYHFYETNWEKTIFKQGFPGYASDLNSLSPFHFSVVGVNNQKARVFGAYAQDIFYIVWFDYNHKILPVALKNT